MSRMIRKQVHVEPRHEEFLKRRSKALGISEAELIRRGIDQLAWGPVKEQVDQCAWEVAKVFIQQRRRLEAPQTGRTWTREQLHDERLGCFSR
jgi:hypothetical protein